jgi:hypothetical protein
MNTKVSDSKLSTGIGPMTDKIINNILDHVNNAEFRNKLNNKLVDPIFGLINSKLRPYIYASLLLYLVILILLIIIIIMIYRKK